jgi:tetratricopeptide (TPR) repeat protein
MKTEYYDMKMKNLIVLIFILLYAGLCFGQNEDIKKLYQEGITLHDNGKYEEAIEKYKKALKIDPSSSTINYEISFSYLMAKDYKNAEKYSKKVIELDNGNLLEAYITYGSALDMLGETNKSIQVYEEAMKSFDNYLLYFNHAISCFNIGETEKAYNSVLKAINKNSSHASSHLLLSKIMKKQGVRIKAMLPLYFFLLIEPTSQRATIEYQTLINYIDQGISKTSDKNITVAIPNHDDSTFGAAEIMISLSKASNVFDENEKKTKLQLFANNNDSIFKMLGELKKDNSGFWWDFYVTFFYNLASENLTEPYSYYISQSQGEEATKWLNDHAEDFEKFIEWMNR